MSNNSPASVLFSKDGYALSVKDNQIINSSNESLLVSGTHNGIVKSIKVDADGYQYVVISLPSDQPMPIEGSEGGEPVTIQGNISFNDESVDYTGSSAPQKAVFTGGLTSTNAPNYQPDQIQPISLTTNGRLRVDSSGTTQTVSGTVAISSGTINATVTGTVTATNAAVVSSGSSTPNTLTYVGGNVTTTAPTYVTGQTNALSLTNAGALRVDGSGSTQTVTGILTANAGSGNFNVVQSTASNLNATVVGAGIAGTPSGGVISIQGVSGGKALNVITDLATTSNVTSVTAANTDTSLLNSNVNRVTACVFNDSDKRMYLKFGTGASTSSFTVILFPGSFYEMGVSYTGAINAFWESGVVGFGRVTEIS